MPSLKDLHFVCLNLASLICLALSFRSKYRLGQLLSVAILGRWILLRVTDNDRHLAKFLRNVAFLDWLVQPALVALLAIQVYCLWRPKNWYTFPQPHKAPPKSFTRLSRSVAHRVSGSVNTPIEIQASSKDVERALLQWIEYEQGTVRKLLQGNTAGFIHMEQAWVVLGTIDDVAIEWNQSSGGRSTVVEYHGESRLGITDFGTNAERLERLKLWLSCHIH